MRADGCEARGPGTGTPGVPLAVPGPGASGLWSALQAGMAEARGEAAGTPPDGAGPRSSAVLDGDLDLMARHAQAGTTLPDMKRYRGVKRLAARAVGRVVLLLAQVVTRKQVQFNVAATTACRDLAAELARQDAELHALRERLRQLEALLADRATAAEPTRVAPPGRRAAA